ncbi:MAG TPA: hypothetical protein VND43_03975 [Burkholderiales bacterium]|nr:hypothetical protein [Burkholderiales bacterium]
MPSPAINSIGATLALNLSDSTRAILWRHLIEPKSFQKKWALVTHSNACIPTTLPTSIISTGCPCCTAALSLQVKIIALVRQHRPTHILIDVHPLAKYDELVKVLSKPPLGNFLHIDRAWCSIELPFDDTAHPGYSYLDHLGEPIEASG